MNKIFYDFTLENLKKMERDNYDNYIKINDAVIDAINVMRPKQQAVDIKLMGQLRAVLERSYNDWEEAKKRLEEYDEK